MAKSSGESGARKSDPLLSPMYSNGTSDMDSKQNVGQVEGPTGGKSVTDAIGYAGNPTKGK